MAAHRAALVELWNDFLEERPFDFELVHQGDGVHILTVTQQQPLPAVFAIELGEWLYNARACLDYIVWSACVYVTGCMPPPDDGRLQYPIYSSLEAWRSNESRLRNLAPHHRAMLLQMQPFNGDADANYLGWVNELARIDRHRRLTVSTAYLAEVEPVVEVSGDATLTLQWGQRALIDGYAQVARICATPWTDQVSLRINPGIGIDPEVAEWASSPFWRKIPLPKRLPMIESFLKGEISAYEYDCTGTTRDPDFLTPEYRAECDAREMLPSVRSVIEEVEWSDPVEGRTSSAARFVGEPRPPEWDQESG